jgi:iron complex outermembrane receptor protein
VAIVRGDRAERAREAVEALPGWATSVDLRARGRTAESLADALEEAPGVHLRRQGHGLAPQTLTLRGAPAAHVPVALDGVVLNDASGDGVDLSLLPPALLERVDVYRGRTPLRFGVAGLGGAVELVTRRAETRPAVWASLGVGSFGARRGSAFASVPWGPLSLLGTLGYRGSQGDFTFYDDRGTPVLRGEDRTRVNNAADVLEGLLRGCVRTGPLRGTCGIALVGWRDRQVPGLQGFQTDGPFLEQFRWFGRLEVPLLQGPLALTLGAAGVLRRDRFVNDGARTLFNTVPFEARATTVLGELSLALRREGTWGTLDGLLRGRHERWTPDGGDVPGVRRSALGGVELELRRGPLRFLGATAFEALEDTHGTEVTARLLASPRAALALALPGGFELRTNLGRSARAPSLAELYGDRGTVTGNPALRPETADAADLGVLHHASGGALQSRLEAVLFARRSRDLIALVQTSRQTFRPVNLERTTALGFEALARLAWGERFGLLATVTFTDATLAGGAADGARVPGVPRWDVSVRASGRAYVGPVGSARWALGASHASSAYLTAANTLAVPARTLLDASLGYTPRGARGLTVGVDVSNLLDARVALLPPRPGEPRQVSALQDWLGQPLPGRAVFLWVTLETVSPQGMVP